jgi:hypothetical protein
MGIDVGVGYIPILPDFAGFDEKVAKGAEKAGKSQKLKKAGQIAGGTFLAAAGAVVATGFDELLSEDKINKQLQARERSTKHAANASIQHINNLSNAVLKLSGIDDEATKSTAAMVLTFRDIRNEAGKGNDVFDRTVRAVTDVATAMNNGATPSAEQLSKTSIQLGKAINDPIKGMGALSRIGVTFTEGQKKQVEGFIKNNEAIKAQKLILGELNKEFGGSAKALGQSLPGQINKAKETFRNLSAELVRGLLPAFNKVLEVAQDVINFLEEHKDFTKGLLIGLGALGAALLVVTSPIAAVVAAVAGLVVGFVEAYKHSEKFREIVTNVGAALKSAYEKALPWVENALHNFIDAMKDAEKWAVNAFNGIKSEINRIVESFKTFWKESGVVRTAVKLIWDGMKLYFGLMVAIVQKAFSMIIGTAKRVWAAIVQVFQGAYQTVKGIVQVFSGVLTGHFGRAWDGVKNIFSGAIKVVLGLIRGITAPAREEIATIGSALGGAFEKVWDTISGVFEDGVNAVGGFLQDLANIINPLLGALGIGEIHISGEVEAQSTSKGGLGKHRGANSYGHKPKKASGGPVTVPGSGNRDTVPLAVNGAVSALVAPGEELMVVNQHQRPLLDAAVGSLGYGSLPGFFAGNNKPHYQAATGGLFARLPGFDEGFLGTGIGPSLHEVGDTVGTVAGYTPPGLAFKAGKALFNTAKTAAEFIKGLPGVPGDLTGMFGEIGSAVLSKVKSFIEGVPDSIFGGNKDSLSGGTTASKTKFAEYMVQAGFPHEARVVAEGLATINAESGFQPNEGQLGEPEAHIGPWAESPAFGSVKTRLDPLGSTEAAYRVGWSPTKSFYPAWGRWEAEQSGTNGATNYASYMDIAEAVLRPSRAQQNQGSTAKEVHNFGLSGKGRGLLPGLASGGLLSTMLARAKELKNVPYLWGGGHGGFSAHPSGLDCSGAVSDVLHSAGLLSEPETSGALESWGSPGYGKNLTVFANAGHAFMEMMGHYWGTWVEGGKSNLQFQPTPPASFRHEYQARHSDAVDKEVWGSGSASSGPETAKEKAAKAAHTFKEDVPNLYAGLKTSIGSFGAVPKSLDGIEKELRERKGEVTNYAAALKHAKKKDLPAIAQALEGCLQQLRARIAELTRARVAAKRTIAEKRYSGKIQKRLQKLSGYNESIAEKERAFNTAEQIAQQIVALEPEEPRAPKNATQEQQEAIEKQFDETYNAYVEGKERPAYMHVLGTEAGWRNEILRGEAFATNLEGNWEDKITKLDGRIDHIESLKRPKRPDKPNPPKGKGPHPGYAKELKQWEHDMTVFENELTHYEQQKAKLPMLKFEDNETKKGLVEARGDYFGGGARVKDPAPPNPGSGTLEEGLINLQGIHWPGQHELIPNLPSNREAGRFGGLIWSTQEQIEGLQLLNFEAGEASEGGNGAGASAEETESQQKLREITEKMLEQERHRNTILQAEIPVFGEFANSMRKVPFGGVFHSGGVVPGPYGQETMILAQSGETVVPLDSEPMAIHTHVHDGAVNPDYIETVVEGVNTRNVSKARRKNKTPSVR